MGIFLCVNLSCVLELRAGCRAVSKLKLRLYLDICRRRLIHSLIVGSVGSGTRAYTGHRPEQKPCLGWLLLFVAVAGCWCSRPTILRLFDSAGWLTG